MPWRPILAVVTLIVCVFVGLVIGGLVHNKTLSTYLGHPFAFFQKPSDVFPGQNTINLMVIGRDYDYSDRDQILKTHARSDMLMVAHIDFVKNTVSLLSIPRDTRALIPGHGVSKINAAHAFGGPALSEKTVQRMFGIPSDYYIALDFDGFVQAIDLLGGVDLTVDKKMDYDDNWGHLHIHLKPGFQHLDGEQAMEFVRFRHSDSDLVRVKRQQALLAALKDKLSSPTAAVKIPAILDAINQHTDCDMMIDQRIVLAHFLHDVQPGRIEMTTLPSVETSGTYVLTDWPRATPMIQSMFGVTPPGSRR
jgi:LCP family protein required for cell wall assembly